MLAASASLLGIKVVILDVGESAPAKQIVSPSAPHLSHIEGSFTDPHKIRDLAEKVDVLTVEIEHVDVNALQEAQKISRQTPLVIHPSPSTIHIIQDKFRQKEHLSSHGCPISDSIPVDSTPQSVRSAVARLGLPLMLKSRTLAYDGRGNYVVRDLAEVNDAISALSSHSLYAEKWVPFSKEMAVMVVRTISGEVVSYPAVETVHKDNICHLVFVPLRSRDPTLSQRARDVAEAAVKTFTGAGIFGVEMFLMENGQNSSLFFIIGVHSHFRGHIHQRDCPTPAQFGALHHRSLRNFTIRESSSRNPLTSARVNRAQSSLSSNA